MLRTVAVLLLIVAGCGPPPSLVRHVGRQHPDVLFSVSTADSVVALTIDDGPHATLTPHLLDVLAKNDARATFFLMGRRIRGNEDVVRRIVAGGHELGNHSMTARPSVRLSSDHFESDLQKADSLLEAYAPVRWFRPASGWFNAGIIDEAESQGYRVALGSVYPNDAQNPFAWYVSWYILRYVRPGSVIILHDGSGWHKKTAAVLEHVLPELRRRGYRVVTLSELASQAP